MLMALQRKNFRASREETRIHSGTTVISHAELPPRSHKRVQVGNTNGAFNRSVSLSALSPIGRNASSDLVCCATNLDLIKALATPGKDSSGAQPEASKRLSLSPPIVRTRQRRILTASPSEGRLKKPTRQLHTSQDSRQNAENPVGATLQDKLCRLVMPTADVQPLQDQLPVSFANEKPKPRRLNAIASDPSLLNDRKKLYAALVNKYGSIPSVYRALDAECQGFVTFKRFDAEVKSLEMLDLSEDVERRIWKEVDPKMEEKVEYTDLFHMLSTDFIASPFKPPVAGDFVDPCSSVALKYRIPLEHSPHSKETIMNFRVRVCNEILKKHREQETVRGGNVKLLMHIFHQFDTNGDGFLSYQQLKDALGKDCLKFDMTGREMDEMIQLIDHNGDDKISMKEFVRYFAWPLREASPDLIAENRDRETRILYENSTVQLTPREHFDCVFAKRQQENQSDCMKTLQHKQCKEEDNQQQMRDSPHNGTLHEELTKRIASLEVIKEPVVMTSLERALADAKHSTSDPLGPDVGLPVAVCQDRYQYRRKMKTDWTRVGYGNDGIRPDTALYMGPEEQFKTTNGELFQSPSRRQRVADSTEGTAATAAGQHHEISGSDFGALDKQLQKQVRDARFERTQSTLQAFEDAHAREERFKSWKQRSKAKHMAALRFDYLDRIHSQEQKVAVKEKLMQKKSGGIRFLRMWAGSTDSQFNVLNAKHYDHTS